MACIWHAWNLNVLGRGRAAENYEKDALFLEGTEKSSDRKI